MTKLIPALVMAACLGGCQSAYYSTMEKFGVHKREILVDRVEKARDAQKNGQEEFKSALEQFKSIIAVDGGLLEKTYNTLNGEYQASESAAEDIRERIDDVESVSRALFDEWEDELDKYSSRELRRSSQQQLDETREKYKSLITSMRAAEKRLQPVLEKMEDQVLYLKHNLNARAISGLKNEVIKIDQDVSVLLKALEDSIAEAERFIDGMKE
ncbi:MAG TPA: DUF2959 domain-containing protein [Marinagarivorans sp.]